MREKISDNDIDSGFGVSEAHMKPCKKTYRDTSKVRRGRKLAHRWLEWDLKEEENCLPRTGINEPRADSQTS
jgi:hypothetical protein